MMSKDVVTSFRVDGELWHKARVYAVENKMTIKELIENLLRIELKENIVKKKLEAGKYGNEGKK
jgi:predicted DNA-binding ribbon-helix-helix protein